MILTGLTLEDAVGGHWIAVCIEEDCPNGVRLAAYRDNYRTRPRAIAYKNFLMKTSHRLSKLIRFGGMHSNASQQLAMTPVSTPPPKWKLLHLKVTVEHIEDLT